MASFPSMVTGFPADIARSRSIELLENLLSSVSDFNAAEIENLHVAIDCLRSDAEHAENEAEIENTPLWWGRLLTQPLEFTAPAWSACQCLNLPAAAQTGDSDHPLVVCAHLLRLDQDPVAPFLPRTLPGKSPSITVAAQPESHPFGIPKRSADAISNSLLNASLSTRISTTVECLDKIGSWEFDVFGLTSATRGWPLVHVAYTLFESYGLFDRLNLNRRLFCNFLLAIEHGCNFNAAHFHNSVHTADMLQACHLLMQDLRLATRVSDFDILACFLAAIIHNYRHPGLTNHYLMASQDALSLLYNDVRTVENFATASAFRLLAEPEYDFLASHDPVTRQKIRQQVIALVFATNLTDQFYFMESVNKMLLTPAVTPAAPANAPPAATTPAAVPVASASSASLKLGDPAPAVASIDFMSKPDPRADLIFKLVIKSADVSQAARLWTTYSRWSRLQMEEFYSQGDLERGSGLTVTKYMDRYRPQEARCHHEFVVGIVLPLFTALEKLTSDADASPMRGCRSTVETAVEQWNEMSQDEETLIPDDEA